MDSMATSLYDLSPLLRMLLVGLLLAAGPLLWVFLRHRRATPLGRVQALTLLTLFLTFDLVLFGAFTRLTDSGLGCPDWPGCYGHASPLGASASIAAAQSAMPTGPVTHGKAWVEMVHRYLATGVGGLILALAVAAWLGRKARAADQRVSVVWPVVTLVWVCIQGAFGALTVTMKLFPAIVTLHLLGGYVLLALLVAQAVRLGQQQGNSAPVPVAAPLRLWMLAALAMLTLQAASGAWVSTNYAVLACSTFPQCQGGWWPAMDFAQGFEIWRPLGLGQDGAPISFQALTAIHMVHRILAGLTVLVLVGLAWRLRGAVALRQPTRWLAGLLVLQLVTGLSNVVLDWPLFAAVLHTGGAGALVAVLVWLLAASRTTPTTSSLAGVPAAAAALQPGFSE
ncbi:COX15/CtaA family protein [Rhodoferax saidenbachensis]|uniref:Heme A synthase n=1 Tax=Rhodoferax saidenbachensis TaxID=1484693 RepID=A0A1P8KDE5_9BURK|nr:COX15/CtaA family protein [Rhodoferax saidenbachensis]APW44005.1 heme A synthase [Rhodoferax saidenbachensis]